MNGSCRLTTVTCCKVGLACVDSKDSKTRLSNSNRHQTRFHSRRNRLAKRSKGSKSQVCWCGRSTLNCRWRHTILWAKIWSVIPHATPMNVWWWPATQLYVVALRIPQLMRSSPTGKQSERNCLMNLKKYPKDGVSKSKQSKLLMSVFWVQLCSVTYRLDLRKKKNSRQPKTNLKLKSSWNWNNHKQISWLNKKGLIPIKLDLYLMLKMN